MNRFAGTLKEALILWTSHISNWEVKLQTLAILNMVYRPQEQELSKDVRKMIMHYYV